MKKRIFILYAFLGFNNLYAQCTLDRSGWKIIFQEEFNGTKADLSTNWYFAEYSNGTLDIARKSCTGDESTYNCASEAMVDVNNGIGFFSVQKTPPFICDGKVATYNSSQLCTKYDEFPTINPPGTIIDDKNGFIFGMFEIRCKLTKKIGTYPTFWLSGNSWPPEIDVFEYHGGDPNFFSTFHWEYVPSTSTTLNCSNYYENTSLYLNDDYHIWTMVWTPTTITMFLDGVEYYEFNDISKIPAHSGYGEMWDKMHVILSNSFICPGKSDEGIYDDFLVDYVRIYKPTPYNNYIPGIDNPTSFFDYQNYLYSITPFKSNAAWRSNIIKPDLYYPSDRVNSGLVGLQGGGKYKYKGTGDLLWCTFYGPGDVFYNYPISWTYKVDDNIVLAQTPTQEITFFRKGGNIFYEDGSFHIIPTISNVASDIVCNATGEYLYYRDAGGDLRYVTRSSGSWSSPVSIPYAPLIHKVRSNTVIYDDNTNRIYYITTTNQIIECNNTGIKA